jgi:hypothetical protein
MVMDKKSLAKTVKLLLPEVRIYKGHFLSTSLLIDEFILVLTRFCRACSEKLTAELSWGPGRKIQDLH